VGPGELPGLLRLTFTLDRTTCDVRQVALQLSKLVEVVAIDTLSDRDLLGRELALITVAATEETHSRLREAIGRFHVSVLKRGPAHLVIEVTGTREDIDACVDLLRPIGLIEVARSGPVAVRGA
jgi:acetolactate synthase-1/3 small subunit